MIGDWILRAGAFLFVLAVAYILFLAVVHEIAVWRRTRDASDWLNRKARDEARSVAQLYSSERDVIATPRKKP